MPKLCREMVKVRFFLKCKKISWFDDSMTYDDEHYVHRTKFWLQGHEFSVINGIGTYGGAVDVGYKNMGLLELRIDEREPVGSLLAVDVIAKIKEYL